VLIFTPESSLNRQTQDTGHHKAVITVPYLPTDVQESCFKGIEIYIKTAPTCFGLITAIRERII
jgi:hypothetical protein